MLLKGWLLLSTVLLPGCTCLLAPSRRRISTALAAVNSDAVDTAIACINQCANDRSQKPDDVVAALAVLRAPDVPAVLFEVGFLTNPDDAERLSSDEGREEFAGFLARAIRVFFARQSVG